VITFQAIRVINILMNTTTSANRGNGFKALVSKWRATIVGKKNLVQYVEQNNIPVIEYMTTPESTMTESLKELQADLFCVAGFPCLIKETIFTIPSMGTLNMHSSLLPAYRGPNPIFWVYYNQEKTTGVTIHYIDAGEDSGPILAQEKIVIPLGIPCTRLYSRLTRCGIHLMQHTIMKLSKQSLMTSENPSQSPTIRAKRPKADTEYIEWDTWPTERIFHFLRGVMPRWYIPSAIKSLPDSGNIKVKSYRIASHDKKPGSLQKGNKHYRLYSTDGYVILKAPKK